MYTDGSKSENGAGFAAASRRKTGSLSSPAQIFTTDRRNHSVVIYCDSRSASQAIKSLNLSHPVVREVQDCLALTSARKE